MDDERPQIVAEGFFEKPNTAISENTQTLVGLHPLIQILRAIVIAGYALWYERLFPGFNLLACSFEWFRRGVIEVLEEAKVTF